MALPDRDKNPPARIVLAALLSVVSVAAGAMFALLRSQEPDVIAAAPWTEVLDLEIIRFAVDGKYPSRSQSSREFDCVGARHGLFALIYKVLCGRLSH